MRQLLSPSRALLLALAATALPAPAATAGPATRYAVADLPAALRENAHAVVRRQDETADW